MVNRVNKLRRYAKNNNATQIKPGKVRFFVRLKFLIIFALLNIKQSLLCLRKY